MKLPNAEQADVDLKKLREYCLNPEHPRGKHKARVFQSALGISPNDAGELKSEIKQNIQTEECKVGEADEFGRRYTVTFEIERLGRKATLLTAWIIKREEAIPKLTTCYLMQ